ncbi:MAG: hypothetical protein ACLP59_18215 [Bryobacteraceae bacterium]
MAKRVLLIAAFVVTVFGAWQSIGIPRARAVMCCAYGEDCTDPQKCCKPGFGQADCSKMKPNYCVDACSQ